MGNHAFVTDYAIRLYVAEAALLACPTVVNVRSSRNSRRGVVTILLASPTHQQRSARTDRQLEGLRASDVRRDWSDTLVPCRVLPRSTLQGQRCGPPFVEYDRRTLRRL